MTKYIYNSIVLSILLHSLTFFLMMITFKNSIVDSKTLTYITIIEEKAKFSSSESADKPTKKSELLRETQPAKKTPDRINQPSKDNSKILEERIMALQAKKKVIESAKVSISKSEDTKSEISAKAGNIMEGNSKTYLALISNLIREKWNIPEAVPKNLEAIVTVKIFNNGQTIIEGFEKKSGNTLFDSSVVRAINNANPLPPPGKEIVVGLRFKP